MSTRTPRPTPQPRTRANPDLTDARCRQPDADPEDWYDNDAAGDPILAAALCAGCPIIEACRTWVMDTEPQRHRYGVTAGLTPTQRARLKRGLRIHDRLLGDRDAS